MSKNKFERDDGIKKEDFKGYPLFSPFLRLFHWIMVICVLTLFATGLYIGNPGFGGLMGQEPTFLIGSIFSMETVRKIHFIAAFILTASFILRIYGAIRYKGDRLMPRFFKKSYWEGAGWAIKHYLFMKTDHRYYLRNSLARLSYFLVYLILIALIITGAAMYAMIDPTSFLGKLFAPVNHLFTEYGTHYVHHILAWIVILFVIIHVYLAFRADLTEHNGEISAMFSGVKYYSEEPYDLNEIVDDPKLAREIEAERKQQRIEYKMEKNREKIAKKNSREATSN